MLDRLLALCSIVGLIAFMGIVVAYVAEPDLAIITAVVLVMAVIDFFLLTRKPKADK
jgi:hypothetical protein